MYYLSADHKIYFFWTNTRRKNYQLVQAWWKNVVLPTMSVVINNIEQYAHTVHCCRTSFNIYILEGPKPPAPVLAHPLKVLAPLVNVHFWFFRSWPLHCSILKRDPALLSTILNNIVKPELGVTILNNIVHNIDNVGSKTLFNTVFINPEQFDNVLPCSCSMHSPLCPPPPLPPRRQWLNSNWSASYSFFSQD